MKLVHFSDLHLMADGEPLNGNVPSARLDACLADIERWHPDAEFCVISGDLAETGSVEAYECLKSRLSRFPLKTFLMTGNHDVRENFVTVYPDHPRDASGYIQYVHETDEGIFIFLDTTIDGADIHQGELREQRLAWLRDQLAKAGDKPTYLFMHHPPFDIGIDYVDKIKLEDPEEFHDALQSGKNIRHIFYGHVHRIGYVNWRGYPFTSLPSLNHQVPLNPLSVDAEFCDEPPAYAVVDLGPDQITVNFNAFLSRKPLHQT